MYGYKIENGIAVVDEHEAEIIRQVFANYNSGMSQREAADKAGLVLSNCAISHLLQRRRYLGDDFYPAIMDKQVFARANAIRIRRAAEHSSSRRRKTPVIYKDFCMAKPKQQCADPIAQAEYIYSLVEVKVEDEFSTSVL